MPIFFFETGIPPMFGERLRRLSDRPKQCTGTLKTRQHAERSDSSDSPTGSASAINDQRKMLLHSTRSRLLVTLHINRPYCFSVGAR